MKRSSIGGQAVIEGVMMRGEKSMALAVRDSEGKIRLETKRTKSIKAKGFWFNFPVIRGAVRFGMNMIDGIKTLMRSADVFGESEPSKFEKWLSKTFKVDLMSVVTVFALLLGVGFALVLYSILPNLLAEGLSKWMSLSDGWTQAFIAIFKVAIMIGYLLLTSFIKDIRRTFMYHGAEHKTINCYEHELDLNVKNVQSCSTLHNRCGTTFLFYTVMVSIIVSLCLGLQENMFLRIGLRLLCLPLVAGLSYELLKALALTDFWLLYPLKLPGLLLQKITTKQPTDDMVEVALAAFLAVKEMDEDESIPEVTFALPQKYAEVRAEMDKELEGVESSDIDWMLCVALKTERSKLGERQFISPTEYDHIQKMTAERKTGKPLQYILANTNFYGYEIALNTDVLIPRFETELLVEQAIKKLSAESQVLDLCTGSGCIAIALQKKTGARVVASDISEKAIEIAKKNASVNTAEVRFICGDMFSAINNEKFDMIIANPPYIKSAEIDSLQAEVKDFEPRLALDGGADGLDFYRRIALEADQYLSDKGYLLLEIGDEQRDSVRKLLESKFTVNIVKDYDKHDRIVIACRI